MGLQFPGTPPGIFVILGAFEHRVNSATIMLSYLSSELDKCANDCKHHVVFFSRTIPIARVDPKVVARVAGALAKRTSVESAPLTGSRLKSNPVLLHFVTGLGRRVICPRRRL